MVIVVSSYSGQVRSWQDFVENVPPADSSAWSMSEIAVVMSPMVVATGTFVPNGAATLTAHGTADVSGAYNATGVIKRQIVTTGVAIGDDLWIVMASGTTGTVFQVAAGYPDAIQSGVVQTKTTTDPSTLSATAMTLPVTTFIPPWLSAAQS